MDDGKLKEIIKRSHETAINHGWWDNARSPLEIYALFHSEISEAVEEIRKATPPVYQNPKNGDQVLPGNPDYSKELKPEGRLVELADLCIRICDYVGRMNQIPTFVSAYGIMRDNHRHFKKWMESEQVTNDIEMMCRLHGYLTQSNIGVVFALVESYCKFKDWNLEEVIELKQIYNEKRSYRHGDKVH